MKRTIIIALIIISIQGNSQGKIDTDRPDQTESSALVPRGWFQAELGLQSEKEGNTRSYLHPTALWKYGLLNGFELRLITEFTTIQSQINGAEISEAGMLPFQIGFKLKLFEEKGLRPQAGLIVHNSFSSGKFKNEKWAPNFRFVMSNKITNTISLGYNLGAEWNGQSTEARWLYTFAPAIEVGEHWKFYVESYGFAGKNHSPEHSLAGGMIYYVSRDVQLDISPSWGLTDAAPDNYVTIGLSFRFH